MTFDDGTATVDDDEGGSTMRDDLRLGMTVEIDSAAIAAGRAAATRIRVVSEMRGEIESVDLAARRFTVLGQTVQVDADTLFGDSLPGGALGLVPGRIVEVHGQTDANGPVLRATRIDRRLAVLSYKLRAPVGAIDTVAKTIRVGTQVYSYAGASIVPADLTDLRWVRMLLRTERNALGEWQIVAFARSVPSPQVDLSQVSLKGLITQFSSATAFRVNGVTVDASQASFPDGTASLRLGTRVVVDGSANAGVLSARQVSIETDDQRAARGFALTGAVAGVDPTDTTLTLRGVPVYWGSRELQFIGGSAADLVNGRRVRLLGVVAADGTRLVALRIEFL